MTRDVLETAAREGVAFVIKMADGEKYRVNARDRIIVGNTRVVVMDDKDIPTSSAADDDRRQLFTSKW